MKKWSKAEAVKHLQELKSPFEEAKPESKGVLPNLAEKIKELVSRNKGVK